MIALVVAADYFLAPSLVKTLIRPLTESVNEDTIWKILNRCNHIKKVVEACECVRNFFIKNVCHPSLEHIIILSTLETRVQGRGKAATSK
jgi:DNA-binding protein